jgi:hypothetical protein
MTAQLLQSLPAIATLGAALITGFGAAALKRKWDVDAERVRWTREAGARLRRELLDAFSSYLAARPSRASIGQRLASAGRGGVVDLDSTLSGLRLEAARLLILLDEGAHRRTVEADLAAVQDWLQHVSRSLAEPSRIPDLKTPDALLDLARSITGAR